MDFIAKTSANEFANRLIIDSVWIRAICTVDPFSTSEVLSRARNSF